MIPSCATLSAFSLICFGSTNWHLILPSLVFSILYNNSAFVVNLYSPAAKSSSTLLLSTLPHVEVNVLSAFCRFMTSSRVVLPSISAVTFKGFITLLSFCFICLVTTAKVSLVPGSLTADSLIGNDSAFVSTNVLTSSTDAAFSLSLSISLIPFKFPTISSYNGFFMHTASTSPL